ncbi:MAG: histidinol-phosphatase [Armatimonadetes bacterium]|nr:histidinol-phosphatase [Armatimonadota bacterium]
MIDYHLHSERSHDASGRVLDTCQAAYERGFSEICFTEHVDFDPTEEYCGYFDYDLYKRQIEDAREVYSGRLEVGFGAEVDFQAKYSSEIRAFLDGKEFDYVIGAVHYVNGILLERHRDYFSGKNAQEAYTPYFENTLAAIETGLFDAIAHLDLCKRHGVNYFGQFDPAPFACIIDKALEAIIARGMSLEINTSGLRQAANDIYPCQAILERYYALGGRNITIGSDSHSIGNVGFGIADGLAAARCIGFSEISAYRLRERIGKAI